MSWRGTEGAIAAARAGHDVVMAPAPILYLDHLQSDSPREPPGRPAVVTLEEIYAFEPVPPGLTPSDARHILGAQLNAWTEHMRLPERIEHQAFPRVAAIAEVAWSPVPARDWQDFQTRLATQFARYRKLGIRYADTAFAPRARLAAANRNQIAFALQLTKQASFGAIHFTRDRKRAGPDGGDIRGRRSKPRRNPF